MRVHGRDKRMSPTANYNAAARVTGGYSGAQLMNVMNVAAMQAVRRGSPAIATEDMLSVTFPTLPPYTLRSRPTPYEAHRKDHLLKGDAHHLTSMSLSWQPCILSLFFPFVFGILLRLWKC